MNNANCDVAIVGAGIVGAACAAEFAGRGLSVVIVDGNGIASGATGAAMGHIVVMDDSEAQFALTRYSQQLWQSLRPELPDEVEFNERGTIWIAADEEEMAEVRRKRSYYQERGVAAEELDAPALHRLEPNLRAGLAGGLRVSGDCVLDPPSAARFLIERAQKCGTRTWLERSVTQIGKGRVLLADGSELAARFIVDAAGVCSAGLISGIEIKRRKGHLAITGSCPGFLRHQLVELSYLKSAHSASDDSVAFNVQPRRSGQILIGSSRQYGAEHADVDRDILGRMLQRAQLYMPGLKEMPLLRSWTGFRAATPDRLPLIGPWPADRSLLLATGHEGLGITTSLGTARILADQITGAKPEIAVEPYWPARVVGEPVHG
jgi:glycine/D-amino acid oxidase-like deaminating enzyme